MLKNEEYAIRFVQHTPKNLRKVSSSFSFIHNPRFSIYHASQYIPSHRQILAVATHNLQLKCFGKNALSDKLPSLSWHYLNDDSDQNVHETACHTPHTQDAVIREATDQHMQYKDLFFLLL